MENLTKIKENIRENFEEMDFANANQRDIMESYITMMNGKLWRRMGSWAIGKGLGKLSKADEVAGSTRYADDIAQYGDDAVEVTTHSDDAIKPVTEAGEHADEVVEAIPGWLRCT